MGTALTILSIISLFLFIFSDDDLVFRGSVSPDVFKREFESHLPEETLFIDYFMEGNRAIFARIKVSEINNEKNLWRIFKKYLEETFLIKSIIPFLALFQTVLQKYGGILLLLKSVIIIRRKCHIKIPCFGLIEEIIIFICSGGTDPSCISNGAICRNKEAFSNVRQYSYTTQKV